MKKPVVEIKKDFFLVDNCLIYLGELCTFEEVSKVFEIPSDFSQKEEIWNLIISDIFNNISDSVIDRISEKVWVYYKESIHYLMNTNEEIDEDEIERRDLQYNEDYYINIHYKVQCRTKDGFFTPFKKDEKCQTIFMCYNFMPFVYEMNFFDFNKTKANFEQILNKEIDNETCIKMMFAFSIGEQK